MTFLEFVGLITVILILAAAGFVGYNHWQFRQWLHREKRRDATGNE